MSRRRLLLLLLLLVPLLFGLLLALWIYLRQPAPLGATLSQPASALPAFALQRSDGKAFDNLSLKGQWSLLFIGYTYCPDICPSTLAQLAALYPELKAQIPNLQVVMLSVDPGRDSRERLAGYVPHFHPEFIAATGPHPQLQPLVSALGLVYSRREGSTPDDYLVDHSASLVLINPSGHLHGRFAPVLTEGSLALFDSTQLQRELPQLVADYQR